MSVSVAGPLNGGCVKVLEGQCGSYGSAQASPAFKGASRRVAGSPLSCWHTDVMVGFGCDVVGGGGDAAAAVATDKEVVGGEGAKQCAGRQAPQARPHQCCHCHPAVTAAAAASVTLNQLKYRRVSAWGGY